MQIKISDATAKQLADFASGTLGLDVPGGFRYGADKIRALMTIAGYEKDYIESVEGAADAKGEDVTAVTPTARKMVSVNIHKQDYPGGDQPIELGVNGKIMRAPRGEDIDLPEEYYEVLNNARKLHYDPAPEGGLGPSREVFTYPFTRLGKSAA